MQITIIILLRLELSLDCIDTIYFKTSQKFLLFFLTQKFLSAKLRNLKKKLG